MAATIDPCLRVRPTQAMLDFVSTLGGEDDLPERLAGAKLDSQLELGDIRWLHAKMSSSAGDNDADDNLRRPHFHELLSGCDVVLPEPKFPERNPELDARIQKLKVEQENREYRMITDNIDRQPPTMSGGEPLSKQFRELNSYMMVIFQFVISVISAFVTGFCVPYYIYGIHDLATRMLVGVVLGFVVAIADMYFVLRFLLEDDGVIDLRARAKKLE